MSIEDGCIFCIDDPALGSSRVEPDSIIDGYDYWWLILQPEAKREKTKQAAGMLVAKRHIDIVSMVTSAEAVELINCVKSAAETLCRTVGTKYTNQETVGYNQGPDAGQTVSHAHVHILPVSEEDPQELKMRGGIGGAFEALRQARLQ